MADNSHPVAWAHRRLDRIVQLAAENYGAAPRTEFASSFVALDDTIKRLRTDYVGVLRMTKQYLQPHPGVRIEDAVYDKLDLALKNKAAKLPICALGNILVHAGQSIGEETTLGSAMILTGEAEKDIGEYWTDFESKVNETWIPALQSHIDNDLKDAATLRRKLEKARLDLDAQRAKVKKNMRSLNYTANTDHKVSVETAKLRESEAKFNRLYLSCENKYKSIVAETQDGILIDLIGYIQNHMRFFQQSLERLVGVLDNVTLQRKLNRRDVLRRNIPGVEAFALYDFRASGVDEVNMRAGDALMVTDQDTGVEGFWEVRINGATGLVPASHVGFYKAVAVMDHVPSLPDDLGFRVGEEIVVLNRDTGESGVYQGFKDGAVGFFPASAVSFGANAVAPSPRPPSFMQPPQQQQLEPVIPPSPHLSMGGASTSASSFYESVDYSTTSTSIDNTGRSLNVPASIAESRGSRSSSVGSIVYDGTKTNILSALEDLNAAMMAASVGRLEASSLNYSDNLKTQLMDATQALTMSARQIVSGAQRGATPTDIANAAIQSGLDLETLKQSMLDFVIGYEDTSLQQRLLMSASVVGTALASLVAAAQTGDAVAVAEKGKMMVSCIGKLMDVVEMAGSPKRPSMDLPSSLPPSSSAAASAPATAAASNADILEKADKTVQRAFQSMTAIKRQTQSTRDPTTYDETMVSDLTDMAILASNLMKAAIEREREVSIQETRSNISTTSSTHRDFYNKNSIWADGFVSCAQSIADTVQSLAVTLEQYVADPNNGPTLDRIVAETSVASSTCKQLDYASRAKGYGDASHQHVLTTSSHVQEALRGVLDRARLARLSVGIHQRTDTVESDPVSPFQHSGTDSGRPDGVRYKAAEIEQHERVLSAEATLAAERDRLLQLRRKEYS